MTTSPGTSTRTSTRTPLRLSLRHGGAGPLDGAWWPQSRDLQTEAADLVDHSPDDRVSRLRLLVVPSATGAPAAKSSMTAASDGADARTAGELLGLPVA